MFDPSPETAGGNPRLIGPLRPPQKRAAGRRIGSFTASLAMAAWTVMSGPLLLSAAGDEPAPTFVLERIDGPPMTVELVGVEKNWQLRFKTGGAELTLAADEVVALRRTPLPAGAADKSR